MEFENIFSLKGKVAIVTGSLGLLGRNFCKALSVAGANIIVTDLKDDECKKFARGLKTESIGYGADITDEKSINNLKDLALSKFGKIDVLVNNAAINDMVENPISKLESTKFENYPVELFRKVLDVNVTGVFITSKIIGKLMGKQGFGSIINIASTYGIVAPNQSLYQNPDGTQAFYKSAAYPASKFAVVGLTKFLASYFGKSGVRVNAISPGGVENNQSEHFIKEYSKRTPLNRMSKVEDYTGGVVFLASDSSSYMTGANLVIDGGWTSW